jgi:hypothetical protein
MELRRQQHPTQMTTIVRMTATGPRITPMRTAGSSGREVKNSAIFSKTPSSLPVDVMPGVVVGVA